MTQKILVSIFICAGFFGLFLFPTNNLDLGWHLKYGEYLVQNQELLNQNTFSWTLPDYRWINHSWGYDLLSYLIFIPLGFIGHTLTNAALGILSLFLIYYLFKPPPKTLIPLIFLAYLFFLPLFAHGLRSQIISLLGLIYSLYLSPILVKGTLNRRQWLLSLTVLLFWANLHGQFMLGLGSLTLYLIGSLITKKLPLRRARLPLLWLLSLYLVTLLNPYGIQNHLETFRYLGYPYFNLIAEWSPFPSNTWQWWLLIIYSLFISIFAAQHRRRVEWSYLGVWLFFGYQAFLYRRISPLFFVTTLPLLIPALNSLSLPLPSRSARLPLALGFCLLVYAVIVPARQPWLKSWSDYCASDISLRCSLPMTEYLNQNPLTGRTFSYYNWGGFLIWNAPQNPVFIDGRMTLWQDSQGSSPLYQHHQIYFIGDQAETQFNQGQFDAAIIQSGIPLEKILTERYGWQNLYRDAYSSILKKP